MQNNTKLIIIDIANMGETSYINKCKLHPKNGVLFDINVDNYI